MSIGPVINLTVAGEGSPSEAQARPPRTQPRSEPAGQSPPASGNVSKPEAQAQNANSAASELSEDEVQLQRDSELENEVIVRYLNKTGNLILQVPGEQMLNFERSVAAEFQRAQVRAAASTEGRHQEGVSHGY